MELSLSLEELEGEIWPQPDAAATGLTKRCHRLRKVPLKDFTSSDLRIMIGQQISLVHLLPLAIQFLDTYPMLESEFYEGDLLNSLLSLDWRDSHSKQHLPQVIAIAKRAHLQMINDATKDLLQGYAPEELGLSEESQEAIKKQAIETVSVSPWEEVVNFLEIHG
jgi:CDI immunity proteins